MYILIMQNTCLIFFADVFVRQSGLEKKYQETVRLIQLCLTFPLYTALCERSMITLKS